MAGLLQKILVGTVRVKLLFLADNCKELPLNVHFALASSNSSRSLSPYNLLLLLSLFWTALPKASGDPLRENWMVSLPVQSSLASWHHLCEFTGEQVRSQLSSGSKTSTLVPAEWQGRFVLESWELWGLLKICNIHFSLWPLTRALSFNQT